MPIVNDSLRVDRYPKLDAGRPIGDGWQHELSNTSNLATLLGDTYILTVPIPSNEDWIIRAIRLQAGATFLDMRAIVVRKLSWGWSGAAMAWVPIAPQVFEIGDVTPAIAVAAWELLAAGGELSPNRVLPAAELWDEIVLGGDDLQIGLNTAGAGGVLAYQAILEVIRFRKGAARAER